MEHGKGIQFISCMMWISCLKDFMRIFRFGSHVPHASPFHVPRPQRHPPGPCEAELEAEENISTPTRPAAPLRSGSRHGDRGFRERRQGLVRKVQGRVRKEVFTLQVRRGATVVVGAVFRCFEPSSTFSRLQTFICRPFFLPAMDWLHDTLLMWPITFD